jgi:hypothetical protein
MELMVGWQRAAAIVQAPGLQDWVCACRAKRSSHLTRVDTFLGI